MYIKIDLQEEITKKFNSDPFIQEILHKIYESVHSKIDDIFINKIHDLAKQRFSESNFDQLIKDSINKYMVDVQMILRDQTIPLNQRMDSLEQDLLDTIRALRR
jgi:6-pyruvoyl-tetrahydropterin synthase